MDIWYGVICFVSGVVIGSVSTYLHARRILRDEGIDAAREIRRKRQE